MRTARQLRRAEERRLRKQNRKNPTAVEPSLFPSPSGAAPAPTPLDPRSSPAHPPVSEAKTAANRANAQLSTGPRTAEGKVIASRNSLRHGLNGAFCILEYENANEFEHLRASLMAEHRPQTPTEELLVCSMAQHYWLTQRALSFQDAVISRSELDEKLFALYMRYQTTHQRAFHRCLNDLLRLQKVRLSKSRGFVSQTKSQPAPDPPKSTKDSSHKQADDDLLAESLHQIPDRDLV